jgi:hypothetical protein
MGGISGSKKAAAFWKKAAQKLLLRWAGAVKRHRQIGQAPYEDQI